MHLLSTSDYDLSECGIGVGFYLQFVRSLSFVCTIPYGPALAHLSGQQQTLYPDDTLFQLQGVCKRTAPREMTSFEEGGGRGGEGRRVLVAGGAVCSRGSAVQCSATIRFGSSSHKGACTGGDLAGWGWRSKRWRSRSLSCCQHRAFALAPAPSQPRLERRKHSTAEHSAPRTNRRRRSDGNHRTPPPDQIRSDQINQ